MRKSEILILGLILTSFAASFYFNSLMPEKMALHWNFKGEVDGYASKFFGLFLIPFVLVGIFLLFLIVPKIDPLKSNIEKFRKYYDGFFILLFVFLILVHLWIIFWNLGIKISPNLIFPIAFGILFFYCGILCQKAKRNWFIGIRTPWTLSDEEVWEKTHEIGGKLFKIAGLISFFGIFFQNHAMFFVIIPPILFGIFMVIYSFLKYQEVIK